MFSPSDRQAKAASSPARRGLNSSYEARLRSPRQSSSPSAKAAYRDRGTIDRSGEKSLLSPRRSRMSWGSTEASSPTTPQFDSRMRQRLGSENVKGAGDVYSDRFIPSRSGSQVDLGFPLMNEDPRAGGIQNTSPGDDATNTDNGNTSAGQSGSGNGQSGDGHREGQLTYSMLLKTELLGIPQSPMTRASIESSGSGVSSPAGMSNGNTGSAKKDITTQGTSNLFKFKKPRMQAFQELLDKPTLSPVGSASVRLLASPRKAKRKIAKVPFKVLDAPALADDFYLNLVDWSSQNVLAVGLGNCVYLWSACTSKVTKLCDLGAEEGSITSVSWTHRGGHVSVGTNNGDVQIWDVTKCKKTRSMEGHTARVGTMAWNAHLLATGSRDRFIYLRDVRASEPYVHKLQGHKQEVCGLRWSFDDMQLASGGNDNKLLIWDSAGSTSPVMKFNDHTAAVKAIAWSPHQHGLLASGGGTADRCIRFRNTLTGTPLNCIDTGSQVCNLMWSKNVNEIVSTHGYSLNQIIVWRYPSMTKVSTLTGHTYRVLYLAMSPDGQTIVTGAGDETLRFWNVFPGPKNKDGSRLGTSLLFPSYPDIR